MNYKVDKTKNIGEKYKDIPWIDENTENENKEKNQQSTNFLSDNEWLNFIKNAAWLNT